MNDNNQELSDCLVMDVLKILKEEEKKVEANELEAGIIRTCISIVLKEVEKANFDKL